MRECSRWQQKNNTNIDMNLLKLKLAEDKTEEVISFLMDNLQTQDELSIVILLSSQLSRINLDLAKGVIEFEQFWRKKNHINESLLTIIEEKYNKTNLEKNKIKKPIDKTPKNKIVISKSNIINSDGDINIGSFNKKTKK